MARIIVAGGGAAGLMAAGRAAELGADVLLLEKTKQLGTKLRMTGNRRCNLGHDCSVNEFLTHLVGDTDFVRNALARFYVPEMTDFFEAQQVPLVTEPDGRMFPRSHNAHDVASALRRYCLAHKVVFRYGSPVQQVLVSDGRVTGVRLADLNLDAEAVILCTGGKSYPKTGSTGDGYILAQALGHTVTPLSSGLVALFSDEPDLEAAAGVVLQVAGTILSDGAVIAASRGELLLTHTGFSGPLALGLSSRMGPVTPGETLSLQLDLLPDQSTAEVERRLLDDLGRMGRAQYGHLVRLYLPDALTALFCRKAGIAQGYSLSQFSAEQRRKTVATLKALTLTLTGIAPLSQAMVTVGGVSCREVVPQTLASRLVQGLYFAGEILDVTGADTGGYNLQLAFSTGYVAGQSAAQQLNGQQVGPHA